MPLSTFNKLGSALLVLAATAVPVHAQDLAAHHATYILSLSQDSQNSGVAGGEGLMVYDLKDTCDGWAVDLKLRFDFSADSGDAHSFQASQVTWEAKDASSYRYLIKNGIGDQTQQLRGEARMDAASGKGQVTADQPSQAEADLPQGTLFPLQHTRLLLEKAAAGETAVSAEYFDGTASTQAMQASAVIGGGQKDWSGLPQKISGLSGVTSYPIDLAFFLGNSPDATPDNEQFMRLYDNGVVGEFSFTIGNIKIHALLDQLKLQPKPAC